MAGKQASGRTRRSGEASSRLRITEQFLIQRLSLEEDWRDSIQLPTELPLPLGKPDQRMIANDIRTLVQAGCREDVVWLCLRQMFPDAKPERTGWRKVAVPGPSASDNEGWPLVERQVSPAEGRQLRRIGHKASALASEIRQHMRDFQMADDAIRGPIAFEHFDPEHIATPTAFVARLVNDLRWLDTLAQNWSTPYQNEALQGTETWYLVAYVEMMPNGAEFFQRDRPHRARRFPLRSGTTRRSQTEPGGEPLGTNALTRLLTAYKGHPIDVEDLISVTHKIRRYQTLQRRLRSCLRAITNRPPTE